MVNADYLVKQRNGHTKFIRLLTLINFSRRITSIWQKIKLSFSFNMIMNIKLLWFSSSSAIMFLVFFFFLIKIHHFCSLYNPAMGDLARAQLSWKHYPMAEQWILLLCCYRKIMRTPLVEMEFYSIDSIENSIEFYSPLSTTKVGMEKFPNIKVWFEIIEIYWNITNSSLLYKLLTVNPSIKKTQLRMSFSY